MAETIRTIRRFEGFMQRHVPFQTAQVSEALVNAVIQIIRFQVTLSSCRVHRQYDDAAPPIVRTDHSARRHVDLPPQAAALVLGTQFVPLVQKCPFDEAVRTRARARQLLLDPPVATASRLSWVPGASTNHRKRCVVMMMPETASAHRTS